MKPWKDKTIVGHALVALGIVLLVTLISSVLGAGSVGISLAEGFTMLAWGVAVGVYYGREVDQEQQKLVFDRTLKDPNVTLKDVGFRRLIPWKWQSIRQRWDMYAALLGATTMLLIKFL